MKNFNLPQGYQAINQSHQIYPQSIKKFKEQLHNLIQNRGLQIQPLSLAKQLQHLDALQDYLTFILLDNYFRSFDYIRSHYPHKMIEALCQDQACNRSWKSLVNVRIITQIFVELVSKTLLAHSHHLMCSLLPVKEAQVRKARILNAVIQVVEKIKEVQRVKELKNRQTDQKFEICKVFIPKPPKNQKEEQQKPQETSKQIYVPLKKQTKPKNSKKLKKKDIKSKAYNSQETRRVSLGSNLTERNRIEYVGKQTKQILHKETQKIKRNIDGKKVNACKNIQRKTHQKSSNQKVQKIFNIFKQTRNHSLTLNTSENNHIIYSMKKRQSKLYKATEMKPLSTKGRLNGRKGFYDF